MCGISGSIRYPIPKNCIEKKLHHRGPDGHGHWACKDIELWHSRLSIIDAHGGSQPMVHGSLAITYNGEIYNFKKIKEQYKLECETESDTEVLLRFIEKFGFDKLDELDGMFAAAVYHIETNTLFLIRDRFGEKPLYVWEDQRRLFFCSDLKTLSAIVQPEINTEYVSGYLKSSLHLGEETVYQNVTEVPNGGLWEISVDSGKLRKDSWFSDKLFRNSTSNSNQKMSLANTVVKIESALMESISHQLDASDLEVGTFLSGGIDSGLVTAMASQHTKGLKSFTVSFDGQFDESELAQATATRYQTHHHNISIDYSDLPDNIESIIRNYGEPMCDDSIIPSWYVSREAKKHVPVVLTGDGADELFGGYRRYVLSRYLNLYRDQSPINRSLAWAGGVMPKPKSKFSKYNYIWRLVDTLGQEGFDRYLSSTIGTNDPNVSQDSDVSNYKAFYEEVSSLDQLTSLQKSQQIDLKLLLTGSYLPKIDIASMAHSLESRSPFLGKEVIEIAGQLPDNLKIRGVTTKFILRELAKKWLPNQTVIAPKRGFETPLQQWTTGILSSTIHEHLAVNDAPVFEYVDRATIQRILKESSVTCPVRDAKIIWKAFTTNVWLTS